MPEKIVIVGAGVAGISAAISLAGRGSHVTLIESRNIPGGRASSFVDKVTGEEIDNGQHVMAGAYVSFFRILRTLGTFDLLKSNGKLRVEYADQQGRRFALDTSNLPGSMGIASSLMALRQVSLRSKLILMKFLFLFRMGRVKADGLTCDELLMKYGQDEDIRRVFWEPLILATLNSPSNLASADIFIEVLRRAFFSSGRNASIYLPKASLTRLLEPIGEWLRARDNDLKYGTTVSGIIFGNGSVTGVRTSVGEIIPCDALILAVPPEQLRKLMFPDFSGSYFKDLSQYSYVSISSIYIWTDSEISGSDFVALLDSPLHWIFNCRRISGSKADSEYPYLSTLTISSSEEIASLGDEELINLCMEELGRAFPESSGTRVLHYRVIHYKRATIRISPDISSKRMSCISSVPNMFFAGDWTATGLPATLESASLSGEIAAAELVKARGNSLPLPRG